MLDMASEAVRDPAGNRTTPPLGGSWRFGPRSLRRRTPASQPLRARRTRRGKTDHPRYCDRVVGDRFEFGKMLHGENGAIRSLTRPNSLFLSAAAQNNHAGLLPIFRGSRHGTSCCSGIGSSEALRQACLEYSV